jgi:hypothetical protein
MDQKWPLAALGGGLVAATAVLLQIRTKMRINKESIDLRSEETERYKSQ